MRFLWIALISLTLTSLTLIAGAAQAQPTTPQGVIDAQIEAFRADDMDRAFSYASPSIRTLFGTPQNFGAMVRQGYPMVWRPADVRYLGLRDVDGLLWQRVRFTDMGGDVHLFDYNMIQTENGWKINAVHPVAPGAPSV